MGHSIRKSSAVPERQRSLWTPEDVGRKSSPAHHGGNDPRAPLPEFLSGVTPRLSGFTVVPLGVTTIRPAVPTVEQREPERTLILSVAPRQLQQRRRGTGGAVVCLHRQGEHRAAHLNRDRAALLQQAGLLHGHQRPKLRIVVLKHKVSAMKANHCVASGYRHVCNAHVALVTAPKLEHLLRQRNHVQPTACMLLGITDHILQHDEWWLGPWYLHQGCALLASAHIRRVDCLAQLAGQGSVEVRAARGV
mmetsp:Transcript_60742/g.188338  ORF Transcript_60742/g.188338 Transcript_60742/m.188338 type:complete len:249 (+) Transcript_60742:46-792(+)